MKDAAFLIVKLGAQGDVLVATALTRALRAARPAARIGFLTSRECLPLLEENPDLDDAIGVEMTSSGPSLRPVALWRLHHQLAAWSEGTAVVLHRHPSLALLCRMAGFRRVVGFSGATAPDLLAAPVGRCGRASLAGEEHALCSARLRVAATGSSNLWLSDAVPFDLRLHRMERQEQLLYRLGVNAPARRMRLVLRGSEQAFGESAWRVAASSPRLVLAPGGGKNCWSEMPNRRWPIEHFREIAARAVEAGMAVQLVGGPDDAPLARLIVHGSGAAGSGVGAWTLRETAAVIAAAHLVVSNDSLPLFLAAALQTPVLGLYGPTDSRVIHPPGAGAALQGAVDCGPCYSPLDGVRGQAYRCPRARCMEALTPVSVWNEIQRHIPVAASGRPA